jgi:uncharacterized protein YdeI (YjbR/CyaY-like superfamily)
MNVLVDQILEIGCGRCKWGGTPKCKVHTWEKELPALRNILLECGLNEEVKWGMPCYTDNNKNVLILAPFKEYCALSFFNGALIDDSANMLTAPSENTQAGRQMRFTHVDQITSASDIIKQYIFQAIEVERQGLKVVSKKVEEYPIPEELNIVLKNNSALKKAFDQLTPGRQKAYLLHFAQPKQSATRTSRIEKAMPDIFAGKGLNEDYRNKKR